MSASKGFHKDFFYERAVKAQKLGFITARPWGACKDFVINAFSIWLLLIIYEAFNSFQKRFSAGTYQSFIT